MVEYHALKYGPFGYRDRKNFRPDFANDDFQRMLKDIDFCAKRSREVFVKDYLATYTSETGLPLTDPQFRDYDGGYWSMYPDTDESKKQGLLFLDQLATELKKSP